VGLALDPPADPLVIWLPNDMPACWGLAVAWLKRRRERQHGVLESGMPVTVTETEVARTQRCCRRDSWYWYAAAFPSNRISALACQPAVRIGRWRDTSTCGWLHLKESGRTVGD
jgi:hypothetical protein